MALFELLIPPAFFGVSTIAFCIAIQLPFKYRMWLSPLLFGSAVVSLSSSHYLALLPSVNTLWGLLCCIWILHATSTLFIDRITIPRNAPPWTSAYKRWNDLQHRVDWAAVISRKPSARPSSRTWFMVRRLCKASICCFLQFCIVGPLVVICLTFTAQDFGPVQQIFLRRLLSSKAGPSITSREIQIRLVLSVYWVWVTYVMLDVCHVLLSIFFVVILRVDTPEEWPSLFGSPLQAYSIRRFWTKFWHRLTVSCSASSGKLITRRMAGMKPGSPFERPFIAFWTFFLSAIYHSVADWQAGEPCRPADDLFFFLANFAAGTLETFVPPVLDRALGSAKDGRLGRLLYSPKVKKVVGFMWLFGFFIWSVPKWQYSKLQAMLQKVEDSKIWDL